MVTTATSPHSFSAARLAALRAHKPPAIAALPGPRIAVILGGKNGIYKFTDACDDRLEAALTSLARLGRQLHDHALAAHPSTPAAGRRQGDRDGARAFCGRVTAPNPYPDFLAHADALIVTANSVNMCGEAAATGKPVYVFTPSGGSDKFARFHAA